MPQPEILISSVLGNSQKLDGGAMFGNAPKALWQKWMPPDDLNRIDLNCRALLIEYTKADGIPKKILCETGIGAFFAPKMAERYGVQTPDRHLLLENLESLGVSENDIDMVILSHLHFDHAGGLLPSFKDQQSGKTDLLFPKATYVVGEAAWERAQNPHPRDRASFIPELNEKLASSKRLVLVGDQKENHPDVFPEIISFRYSQGHTPGQMHVVLRSPNDESKKLFFAGDLIPGSHWVNLPITMGYDRFPEVLIEEKQKLYQEILEQDWTIFFTHDNQYSSAKISKNEKGRFEATSYENELLRVNF